MECQHLSQTKNALASSHRESALAQLTEGIARSSTHPIEELQGSIGNQAVNRLLANQPIVQAKQMFRGLSQELTSEAKVARGEPVNVAFGNQVTPGKHPNAPVQCAKKKKQPKYIFSNIEDTEEQSSSTKETEILPMPEEPKFDEENMSFEEKNALRDNDSDKFTEGYYSGIIKKRKGRVQDEQYPEKPKKHKKKWIGQEDWLTKLENIESELKKYKKNLTTESLKEGKHRYNYQEYPEPAKCRLCKKNNGQTEYQINYKDSKIGLVLVR